MDNKRTTTTAYVPAQAPAAPEPRHKPANSRQVLAGWLDNLGGGLGAGAVVAAGWFAVHGLLYRVGILAMEWPKWEQMAIGCGVVVLGTWGALMFVRSSLDEIVAKGDWDRMQADLDAAGQIIEAWKDKCNILSEELRQLRAEILINNQQAARARKVEYTPPAAPDTRGIDDARTLLERATRNMAWSRDTMKALGWTQPQWELAKQTLIAARLLVYEGKWPKLVQTDYELACAELEKYKVRISQASFVVTQRHDTRGSNDTNDISG